MVIDFDDLQVLVKKAVVDRGDHATLLWSEDPLVAAIAQVQAAATEKMVRPSGNPNVELLAREACRPSVRASLPGSCSNAC